ALLADHLVAFEHQPREVRLAERGDEGVALPLREQLARVEHQARGRDHRVPVVDRLHESRAGGAFADWLAAVLEAVADHRPAVVRAGLDPVELVDAERADVDLPQLVGAGPEGEAERVAEAEGVELGPRAGLAGERAARGGLAVRGDPHDLADAAVEL